MTRRRKIDPLTYEAYLKGRFYLNKRTEEELNKAHEYFQQAIEKDPNYAQAYAGLADYYTLVPAYGSITPAEAIPKAKKMALKALEIDESSAEAHTSLALILGIHEYDLPAAFREFSRALDLNPNYALAHMWYGGYLVCLGRSSEALEEITRAQELDPLSSLVHVAAGFYLFNARQYDLSIEQTRKSLEIEQNYPIAHWALGLAYQQKQMTENAIIEIQKAVEQSGSSSRMLAALGSVYASA